MGGKAVRLLHMIWKVGTLIVIFIILAKPKLYWWLNLQSKGDPLVQFVLKVAIK